MTYLLIDRALTTEDNEDEDAYEKWGTMDVRCQSENGTPHVEIYLRRRKYSGRLLWQEKNSRTVLCNCELIEETISA